MDELDQRKFCYELVNSWIANADNKVSVSCGIFTGVFGVINFLADKYVKVPQDPVINELWHTVFRILFIISLVAMGIAIFFYVLAISPNLKSNSKTEKEAKDKKFPIYYGDISGLSDNEYAGKMNKATVDDMIDEIQRETQSNANICMKKMKRYRRGLWTSFTAIILAGGAWAAHYLMYHCA